VSTGDTSPLQRQVPSQLPPVELDQAKAVAKFRNAPITDAPTVI
jgi:hypothetical protein